MSDLNKIIEDLSKLTVVEAAELSKQLEEKWGVTAAAPVAAAAGAAAEEKSEFTVFLTSFGEKKITFHLVHFRIATPTPSPLTPSGPKRREMEAALRFHSCIS